MSTEIALAEFVAQTTEEVVYISEEVEARADEVTRRLALAIQKAGLDMNDVAVLRDVLVAVYLAGYRHGYVDGFS